MVYVLYSGNKCANLQLVPDLDSGLSGIVQKMACRTADNDHALRFNYLLLKYLHQMARYLNSGIGSTKTKQP